MLTGMPRQTTDRDQELGISAWKVATTSRWRYQDKRIPEGELGEEQVQFAT